jgi:hypothetical protein
MAKRAEILVEGTEAFLESRVVKHEGQEQGAASDVLVGSFAFTSVQSVEEPKPRWQRGLAERLKRPGATRQDPVG